MLITLLIAIGLIGPGLYSLDRRLPFALPGPHTFILAVVGTLIVGFAVLPTMSPPAPGR